MGEASPLKVGVPRPRPLGLVKRESIHFEDVESTNNVGFSLPFVGSNVTSTSNHNLNWNPTTLLELGRSKTESDIKRDLRSMRDLQETLRQAALLNIVAAVNHDGKPSDITSVPPTRATGGSQSVGIKGASILGHNIPMPGNKLINSSNTNEGINNISHFSHNLQNTSVATPSMATGAGTQQSAVSQILSHRTRTISIPRPRTQHEQAGFMHKSLLDAKENLTTFRSGVKKENEHLQEFHAKEDIFVQNNADDSDVKDYKSPNGVVVVEPTYRNMVRAISCIRGTGFDSIDINHDENQHKVSENHGHSSPNQNMKTKEEQRAHTVHQMQSVKRHIPTSKKKELMKKLTEIAKCEAIDMAVPLTSTETDVPPPIIIMSQQKESIPVYVENTTTNRVKSMTSLDSRQDEPRVPSNTRAQSETLNALLNHRETKKKAALNVDEDLIIGTFNGTEKRNNGVDYMYRTYRDHNIESQFDTYLPKSSYSPDFLELRPVEASQANQTRASLAERRRTLASRRSLAQNSRDKLISPSPVVYEASYHRPKASIGQITLVGQSVQSISDAKDEHISALNKPKQKANDRQTLFGLNKSEENNKKVWSDPKAMSMKHWGSTAKPSTDSPILRTEIVDHLQCIGFVTQRPNNNYRKKYNFKASSIFQTSEFKRFEDDFFHSSDEEDNNSSCDTPTAVKNSPQYRKSKLYNAFRASEENLSTLADNSFVENETMMGKSLLQQQTSNVEAIKEATPPPPPSSSQEPVNTSTKEPLYMGCSSRVSENDFRSKFHYVNESDEKAAEKGASFKVMKAIDQDVYFDFQHRKYRKTNDSPMNTASDKPRMHFLKIKFNGEAKA